MSGRRARSWRRSRHASRWRVDPAPVAPQAPGAAASSGGDQDHPALPGAAGRRDQEIRARQTHADPAPGGRPHARLEPRHRAAEDGACVCRVGPPVACRTESRRAPGRACTLIVNGGTIRGSRAAAGKASLNGRAGCPCARPRRPLQGLLWGGGTWGPAARLACPGPTAQEFANRPC